MNRNVYTSDYSVPSLSLTSSRSKKPVSSIPTKDISESNIRSEFQMDRNSRPPIFMQKNARSSKISITNSTSNFDSTQNVNQSRRAQGTSINRNAYLAQEQSAKKQSQMTFRADNFNAPLMRQASQERIGQPLFKSSSAALFGNPESSKEIASMEIQRKVKEKKIDVNKSLFERRIKQLMQQSDFYTRQLQNMYSQNNDIENQLKSLEEYRKEALSLDFGAILNKI